MSRSGHPGFDGLVAGVVAELDRHGLTLSTELVRDELRLLLRLPASQGGFPTDEPLDLLGDGARRRLADRVRRRLHLPDLVPSADDCGTPDPGERDDEGGTGEPCSVVELAARRRP